MAPAESAQMAPGSAYSPAGEVPVLGGPVSPVMQNNEPLLRGETVGEPLASSAASVALSSALGAREGTTAEEGLALSLAAASSQSPREVPSRTPFGHVLLASIVQPATTAFGLLGAGSALGSGTSWPAFPGPVAPAGSLPGGFGSSPGTAGGLGLLGALALLFALSPPARRLLRSSGEFLRPTSALSLVAERPG